MKTKLFSLLFVLLASAGTIYADKVQIGELYYNLDSINGTAEVTSGETTGAYTGSIVIPSAVVFENRTYSVANIGQYAFYGCTGLTSITIPNSVTSIGDYAFKGCTSLPVIDNLRYADTYLIEAIDKTLSTYHIGQGTKWIGRSAFMGCTSLTSITIPNSVTNIGGYAFYECSGLTSVTLGKSVSSIGGYAFYKCTGLTTITIPNGTKSIGNVAFSGCTGLTSISLPNSITSIGRYAFSGCTGLTSITIPNTITSIKRSTFDGCKGLTSITIPNSVTKIDSSAFSSCSGLTSIEISNSVTSIGRFAFSDCIGLTSIDIPNSVKTIGEYAFSECRSMLYTNIPNTIDSIGEKAFKKVPNINYYGSAPGTPWGARCVNGYVDGLLVYSDSTKLCLKGCSAAAQGELVLPDGIVEIGNYAFWKCYGLTNIVLPEGIIEIGNSAFQFCEGLTNLVLPNTLMRIDTGAISVCSKLTSIAIPENVTSIGAWAFGNDTALSNVTISSSVSTIEEEAFDRCNHLTNFTNYALTPQNADSVFVISRISLPYLKLDLSNCTLHVPQGSIELYKAASGWKDFGKIEPISAKKTETDTVTVETTESSAEIVWPQITGAYTYELIIRDAQGNVVCTLIFDAEGRLISLSFNAPARDNTPQQTQVAGFAFTVTSLNVGTTYSYTITAKDESGTTLNVETGSFTTKNPQAIESVSAIHGESTKFLRDGQILILRGDKTYTLTGQEVK